MKCIGLYATLFAVMVNSALVPTTARAVAPMPTVGTAVIDGNYSEWDLANDFFSYMYRAGDSTKVAESRLYLRYDCATRIAYALVLCQPGVIGYVESPDEVDAWI